jgi:2,4-dienoyl-CoA reductase-like NADH-dependent reductase (Old Yellow Enzyme family)
VVFKNRLVKAAMSDSLGDGPGNPSIQQALLYERWAKCGVALSIIGEVQVDFNFPEKPGNLMLGSRSDDALLRQLTDAGSRYGTQVWP